MIKAVRGRTLARSFFMASPLESSITTNAGKPKSATVDGDSASQHSLTEQIEADKHLANLASRGKSKLSIRRMKVNPNGLV